MTPTEREHDIALIIRRMENALARVKSPYQPPEVRLGCLVALGGDAVLVMARLAGYAGDFEY